MQAEGLTDDALIAIFSQLSCRVLEACCCVCLLWNELGSDLWPVLVKRDFPGFLTTNPATLQHWKKVKERILNKTQPGPEDCYPLNPFAEIQDQATPLIGGNTLFKQLLQEKLLPVPGDWKSGYASFDSYYDLNGVWTAIYGPHGREYVSITQSGFQVLATKLRGDVNVPATKRTFEVTFCCDPKYAVGRIHLAQTGYMNPYWNFAAIEVINSKKFVLHWFLRYGASGQLVSQIFDYSENQNISMGKPETEALHTENQIQ